MIGIGLDVVELGRFRRVLVRTPTFGRRVFTPAEVEYAERRRDPTERYAVRFAAKEAVLKAMGVGLWSCPLNEIEVIRASSGEPSLTLHGAAGDLAAERGIDTWRLTLTHTDLVAQAIAVAFGAVGGVERARIRVKLLASDLERTVSFYEDVLGFVVEQIEDRVATVVLGGAGLDIFEAGRSGGTPPPDELMLEVPYVDRVRMRADRHGVPIVDLAPDDPASAGPLLVIDPDGVAVHVVQLHGPSDR